MTNQAVERAGNAISREDSIDIDAVIQGFGDAWKALPSKVDSSDKAGRLQIRGVIEDYQSALQDYVGSERGCAEEINDNGLKEHFVAGAYIRQLLIPKGITIVSRLWKNDRFWIITEGDVVVISESGKQHIKAPYYGMAPYGSKVALYANEDTMWFAITGSDAKDSESAENDVFVEDYEFFKYPWLKEDK
jgi:hypothetical protein